MSETQNAEKLQVNAIPATAKEKATQLMEARLLMLDDPKTITIGDIGTNVPKWMQEEKDFEGLKLIGLPFPFDRKISKGQNAGSMLHIDQARFEVMNGKTPYIVTANLKTATLARMCEVGDASTYTCTVTKRITKSQAADGTEKEYVNWDITA